MAGNAPVVLTNTLTSDTVNPGGTVDWTVNAQDATARTFTMTREITDSQGNVMTVTKTVTISDALTYGPATTTDPDVTLTIDPVDPRVVHVSVDADA